MVFLNQITCHSHFSFSASMSFQQLNQFAFKLIYTFFFLFFSLSNSHTAVSYVYSDLVNSMDRILWLCHAFQFPYLILMLILFRFMFLITFHFSVIHSHFSISILVSVADVVVAVFNIQTLSICNFSLIPFAKSIILMPAHFKRSSHKLVKSHIK